MSPAWVAVIEQAPGATIVTVEAETVQTAMVVDAKLTGRPEDAVAVRAKGADPKAALESGANVMLCEPMPTVKLWETGEAAL